MRNFNNGNGGGARWSISIYIFRHMINSSVSLLFFIYFVQFFWFFIFISLPSSCVLSFLVECCIRIFLTRVCRRLGNSTHTHTSSWLCTSTFFLRLHRTITRTRKNKLQNNINKKNSNNKHWKYIDTSLSLSLVAIRLHKYK